MEAQPKRPVLDEDSTCMVRDIEQANQRRRPVAGDTAIIESSPIALGTLNVSLCGRCAITCSVVAADGGVSFLTPHEQERTEALCPER